MDDAELRYSLALHRLPQLSDAALRQLLLNTPCPNAVFELSNDGLRSLGIHRETQHALRGFSLQANLSINQQIDKDLRIMSEQTLAY